jgi:hemoglobin
MDSTDSTNEPEATPDTVNRDEGESALYDALGGAEAIALVVDRFYVQVLDDPLLAPYFVSASMPRLRLMQREFMAAAFGGPTRYSGAEMRDAHAGMGIGIAEFNRVVELLTATLVECGVGQDLIDQVLVRLAPLADDIVEAPATG